ncbi:unnamed protein product [Blepharisma stoltei]|uniref:P-type phospholipid transporter n=1 Tax=Blepharisma stoltei TaxID=1481888 RepID=A0AAU9K7W4_9CILI|nr:unnamed protein product [Blepharisma stoltei]
MGDDKLFAASTAPGSDFRQINIDRGRASELIVFPTNYITTAKYTYWNLLPKNLFEQFHRIANIWFLIVSILQLLPLNLSPTSNWATIAPLSLVLTVTLCKDIYLDWCRHKMDRRINNKRINIWDENKGKFIELKWQDLEVGNIVLLTDENCQVPADLMLLTSSHPEKFVYIETSSLDGESNLKIRHCVNEIANIFENESPDMSIKQLYHLDEAVLKTEQPNNKLHALDASLKLRGHPRAIPIDINQIILRGSSIRNTKWVLGLVVFTGIDTKLMKNSKPPPHKRSNVERKVNKYLALVFSILFIIVLISTSISLSYTYNNKNAVKFFTGAELQNSPLVVITFLILYNSLVPISLYVTMDCVRIIQSQFIKWDLTMYSEKMNQPAIVKTTDLNEDLGQIEYIFTDKTGTLTENIMEFKKCYINGKSYGFIESQQSDRPTQLLYHPKFKFEDPQLLEDLQWDGKDEISAFFESLALCHTVIPDHVDGELVYQAASPDEEALVIAAHCFGFSYISSKNGIYTLQINLDVTEYKILGINEFSSDRKRMSIVVFPINDRTRKPFLVCKGADNVMLERCLGTTTQIEKLTANLYEFSVEGLRIMIIARKELTEEEALAYEKKYSDAKNALNDKQKRLAELAEELEQNMTIVGATAIEDKIQENVPEAISTLINAGIKIWVLTGDKQETAINIGFSCHLLKPELQLMKLNGRSVDETRNILRYNLARHVKCDEDDERKHSVLSQIRYVGNTPSSSIIGSKISGPRYQFIKNDVDIFDGDLEVKNMNTLKLALIVDGVTLGFILSDPVCLRLFVILSTLCKSVICCRVSPLQKAEVVKTLKNHLAFKPMTLAIGDGANDVSMIQEAHVGIGIVGKEGMQAVNSSDYAIARFYFLLPLLLKHGRNNYARVSKVILYSFYKNFMLVLPLFYFSFFNAYSGTALYDSWLMVSYNIIFTSLPIAVVGSMNKDLEGEIAIANPIVYLPGIFGLKFNFKIFLRWCTFAIVHTIWIFFLLRAVDYFTIDSQGSSSSLDLTGTAGFFAIIITVTYVIALEMKDWTLLFVLVTTISLLLFYPIIFIYDYGGFPTPSMVGISTRLYSVLHVFLYITFVPLTSFILNITVYLIRTLWSPTASDKIIQDSVLASKKYSNDPQNDSFAKDNFRLEEYSSKLNKVYINKGIKNDMNEDEDSDFYAVSNITLQFKRAYNEKVYKLSYIDKRIKYTRAMLIVITFIYTVYIIPDMVVNTYSDTIIVSRCIIFVVLIGICIFTKTQTFRKHCEFYILTITFLGLLAKFINESMLMNDGSMSTAIVPIALFILFNVSTYKMFILNLLFLIMYFIRITIYIVTSVDPGTGWMVIINYLVLLSGIFIISAYVGYKIEKFHRLEFILDKKLQLQFQKGQDILGNLLPGFVKERVKQGVRYIAEEQGQVTCLFCDIYDFDTICAIHTPNELLELLDKFFAIIDALCDKHGVTKIETVNKTYMICGGLKDSEERLPKSQLKRNHAERCLDIALHIIKKIEPVVLKNGHKLQVKIGINTGPVIAGVVGEHKPQFSLVGDTINTAARMCGTITIPDRIQISMDTYNLLTEKNRYLFSPNEVEPKGKPKMHTFFVESVKNRRGSELVTALLDATSISPDHSFYAIADEGLEKSQEPLIQDLIRGSTVKDFEDDRVEQEEKFDWSKLRETASAEDEFELELAGPMHWLMCSFYETPAEHKFRIHQFTNELQSVKFGLWLNISVYTVMITLFTVLYTFDDVSGSIFQIVARACYIAGLMIYLIYIKQLNESSLFPWGVMMLYIVISFINNLNFEEAGRTLAYAKVLQAMFTNITVNHISALPIGFILTATVVNYIAWICMAFSSDYSANLKIETTFFVTIFFLLNYVASFVREFQARRSYDLNKCAEREIKNTDKLLSQMMPPQVLRNLLNDVATTDKYTDATIIYADICGFTSWSSNRKPIEVVGMLSKLFTNFDHLCVMHNVYKVHTIGDCYVVLSFTDNEKRDYKEEAVKMVEMALDMVKTIKRISKSKGISLNMRIGMHTGEVVAGITGTNIVRYDIYGPDNDIANKMESKGFPGRINVSEVTKAILQEMLPSRFDYVFNTEVTHDPTHRTLNSYFIIPLLEKDIIVDEE